MSMFVICLCLAHSQLDLLTRRDDAAPRDAIASMAAYPRCAGCRHAVAAVAARHRRRY